MSTPYNLNFPFFVHLDSMVLFTCLCVGRTHFVSCRICHPFQRVTVAPDFFRFLVAILSSSNSLVIYVSVLNSVEYCSWVWFPENCGRHSEERNSPLRLRTARSCNPGLWNLEGARSHEHPLFDIVNVIHYISLIDSQRNSQWVILEFIQDKMFGMVSCSNYILKSLWNFVDVLTRFQYHSVVQITPISVVFRPSTTSS